MDIVLGVFIDFKNRVVKNLFVYFFTNPNIRCT